jgi:hypothetical protein
MSFRIHSEYTIPTNSLVHVGEIMMGNNFLRVSCIPKTRTVYINNIFIPKDITIGESLEWYAQDPIKHYEIRILCYQLGSNEPRAAHKWERNIFFQGRWTYYAKNNIYVSAVIISTEIDIDDI